MPECKLAFVRVLGSVGGRVNGTRTGDGGSVEDVKMGY